MTRTELYAQFSVAVLANWTIVRRKPDAFLDRFVLGVFCGEPSTSDQLACKEELREQLQKIVALNKREAKESVDKFVKSCKANKGRKINLFIADKLFDGFKQRIAMVNAEDRYGVSVAVVLLFGSYMRREATVGDIDLMVLCVDKPNYELRREELSLAGLSRTIVDWAYGPQLEVIKVLKNRSGWFSLHDTWELARLETEFQIVYCDAAFRTCIDAFANGAISRKQLFEEMDGLRRTLTCKSNV